MTLKSLDVPRDVANKSTRDAFVQTKEALVQHSALLEFYAISVPLFPYAHSLPVLGTHTADASTVALWQGDPPGNGGNGLLDSSGHGFALEAVGTPGYGAIGVGQEAFSCDGTNYWRRAGSVNDALLNATFSGSYTLSMVVRPMNQPNGYTAFDYGGPDGAHGGASDVDHDSLANINLKTAAASLGPNVINCGTTSLFYETGAAAGHTLSDTKIFPFNEPKHLTLRVAGLVADFFVDGFKQSSQAVVAKSATVAPKQFVHIGADHNALFPFIGFISSVKVSNVSRTDNDIRNESTRCLGLGGRSITSMMPVHCVLEDSEMVAAYVVPDPQTGTFSASDAGISIYKFDPSGSTTTQILLGKIDPVAQSSTAWSSCRAKPVTINPAKVRLSVGDVIAIAGSTKTLNGSLTMKFRRLVAA